MATAASKFECLSKLACPLFSGVPLILCQRSRVSKITGVKDHGCQRSRAAGQHLRNNHECTRTVRKTRTHFIATQPIPTICIPNMSSPQHSQRFEFNGKTTVPTLTSASRKRRTFSVAIHVTGPFHHERCKQNFCRNRPGKACVFRATIKPAPLVRIQSSVKIFGVFSLDWSRFFVSYSPGTFSVATRRSRANARSIHSPNMGLRGESFRPFFASTFEAMLHC